MKKILFITALILTGCSNDDDSISENCKTINSKESKVEHIKNNTYGTVYYFVLDGVKTKTTKQEFENKNVGDKICTSLNY